MKKIDLSQHTGHENPMEEISYDAAREDLARSFILDNSGDTEDAEIYRSSANTYALLTVAEELKTANLLNYYATTGTNIYNERQREELTRRLGIPETPIVPLSQEAAAAGFNVDDIVPGGGLPTKADLEAEIEACARDLWKADPGNNTSARSFDEDYLERQDRYRAMARAALGLTDEPKDKK